MNEYLTVGELKNILNNIPDESEIWFWIEDEENGKEELKFDNLSTFHDPNNNTTTLDFVLCVVDD